MTIIIIGEASYGKRQRQKNQERDKEKAQANYGRNMNIKHLQGPYKHIFMNEDEIAEALSQMERDASLKTIPSYERDTPDSIQLVSFREKHLSYLKGHPKLNPEHYLSNLRTMLKIRP